MDPRSRILEAAARCYAELGSRGATTRRIAEAAGVNEITLFRHFGSKEALLDLVVHEWAAMREPDPLPAIPVDPVAELTAWVRAQHDELVKWRPFIRRALGEATEHPDATKGACETSTYTSAHLQAYVDRLRQHGFLAPPDGTTDVAHACVMLPATLFSDALWRDVMPSMFPTDTETSLAAYVRLFGRAIGLRPAALAARSTPPDAVRAAS